MEEKLEITDHDEDQGIFENYKIILDRQGVSIDNMVSADLLVLPAKYDEDNYYFAQETVDFVKFCKQNDTNIEIVSPIDIKVRSLHNQLLKNKEYKSSWNTLQDCLDLAVFVGKFTDLQNRFDLPDIIQLLSKYEKLYPYNLFLSSEFIIKSAHCSICGKSMLNLDCPHIAGNIYWGEIAIRCVDEIEKFQAIALVRNPEDKRCIIESEEMQKLPESERFKKLYLFCNLNKSFLINFDIEEKIENRRDLSIPKQGRNDRCACGSGLKFKKCCIDKMYYKHLHNILIPLNRIALTYF